MKTKKNGRLPQQKNRRRLKKKGRRPQKNERQPQAQLKKSTLIGCDTIET